MNIVINEDFRIAYEWIGRGTRLYQNLQGRSGGCELDSDYILS